jgi:hypothetical protein
MPAKKFARAKKSRKLRTADFCGDGEPFTEIEVRISIRVLNEDITRSRLAATIFPDPALEKHAVKASPNGKHGRDENGVFALCLSENFNGWEEMDEDYPRVAEDFFDESKNERARAMNEYIQKSVDWTIALHRAGLAEARQTEAGESKASGTTFLM